MMFNKRRQSQDENLRKDIRETINDKVLYMNEYSYKLYQDIDCSNIKVLENFMDICEKNQYCLVEDKGLNEYSNKIEEIIIYKWNRDYPSDFKFDIDVNDGKWEMIKACDFEGKSHKQISKEIYRRKENE